MKRGALEDFLSFRFCVRLELLRQQHNYLRMPLSLLSPSLSNTLKTLHKHLQSSIFKTQIIKKRITSSSQEPH